MGDGISKVTDIETVKVTIDKVDTSCDAYLTFHVDGTVRPWR